MGKIFGFLFLTIGLIHTNLFSALAGGVVSQPTDAALRSAISSGGIVTFNFDGVITLTNSLNIRSSLVIDATGRNIEISGNDACRLFQLTNNITLKFIGLTLRNGRADTNFNNGLFSGGALYASTGRVDFVNCRIINNAAFGAVVGLGGATNANINVYGGAIYSSANLNFDHCRVEGNFAQSGSLLENADYIIGSAVGGFLYQKEGRATFLSSIVQSNRTIVSGPGGRSFQGQSFGGAVFVGKGDLFISNSVFHGNSALARMPYSYGAQTVGGGAIYFTGSQLRVDGSRFSLNSALGAERGDGRWGQGTLSLGGAIAQFGVAQISRSLFSSNSVFGNAMFGDAGGGAIASGNTLYLNDCEIASNFVLGGTGNGYASQRQGAHAYGGGLYLSGTNFLERITIHHNVSYGGSGDLLGGNAFGGGVYSLAISQFKNVTLASNSVNGGGTTTYIGSNVNTTGGKAQGGAIYQDGTAQTTLVHGTVVNNLLEGGRGTTHGSQDGSAIANSSGTISIANTILSDSSTNSIVFGAIIDKGHNLLNVSSSAFSDPSTISGVDPLLASLADNHGYVQTMALLPGSPALDHGTSNPSAPTDARGVPRPQGTFPDIGAYEFSTPRQPVLTSASAYKTRIGDWIHIYGTNLIFTTNVSFAVVSAEFQVVSDQELLVRIPAGFVPSKVQVVTTDGGVLSSQTFSFGPLASLPSVVALTPTSALLSSTVRNDDQSSKVYVQYGEGTSYSKTSGEQFVAPNESLPLSFTLPGLQPNRSYAARAVVESASITNYSDVLLITAPAVYLSVFTLDASHVTTNSATLSAGISANDPAAHYYVRFGISNNNWKTSTLIPVHSTNETLSVGISNLVAGQTYFYQAVAADSFSTVSGAIKKFVTTRSYHEEGSLKFNGGTVVYGTVPGSSNLTLFPLTIQLRFKTAQSNAYVGLVHKYLSASSAGYFVYLTNGFLGAKFGPGKNLNGGFVADNAWHQAAFVITTNQAALYLDGVLKGAVLANGPSEALGVPITFCKYLNAFSGSLGEISLWNRVFTEAEIKTTYLYAVTGSEPGLVALWRFANNLEDSTASGLKIQLVGTPVLNATGPGIAEPRQMLSLKSMNGSHEIQFQGTPGQPFRVQTSTNLVDWTDLPQQLVPDSGQATMVIPETSASGIFYRTVTP